MYSYGTLEGRLEETGARRVFILYEALTGREVDCYFGLNVQLSDLALARGRRVAVSGRISEDRLRINAHSFVVFPPDNELPTAADVLGILSQ